MTIKFIKSMYQILWIKRLLFFLLILLFLFIFLGVPILSELEIWIFNQILNVIKDSFNLIYLFSSSLLVIGLYLTYKQIISTQKQVLDNSQRAANESSLEYLKLFANEIIPLIDNYNTALKNKKIASTMIIENFDPSETDYKVDLFQLQPEVQNKVLNWVISRRNILSKNGPIYIFNQLEFFSAAVMRGVANEEVLFSPLHKTFLGFINKDIILLSSLRFYGAPFEHTMQLYKLWTMRLEAKQKDLQIQELESKIKDIRESISQDTPEEVDYIGKK